MFSLEFLQLRHAINEAHNKSDLKEIEKQHKLHGSCCYTGVSDLKNLSQQLEESLKLYNRNSLQVTLNQLNSEIDRVLHAIQEETYDNSY